MAVDQVLAQIRSMSLQTGAAIKPAAQSAAALQPGNTGAVQGPTIRAAVQAGHRRCQ
jgi:hypothetical protein